MRVLWVDYCQFLVTVGNNTFTHSMAYKKYITNRTKITATVKIALNVTTITKIKTRKFFFKFVKNFLRCVIRRSDQKRRHFQISKKNQQIGQQFLKKDN